MFLSSLQTVNAFTFGMDETLYAKRAAIQAELSSLPDYSGRISIATEGDCLIVEGTVGNQIDYNRTIDIASDIAGAGSVIFRIGYEAMPSA
ncbi:BON domain-containing protein [Neorhizobium sp. NPDC001467]|uniref:BON domain-containing protein n=1 Tax=Neorhizobium sp. NPDC001467 TaxID=3390595 RepID=UPI003D037384